MKVYSSMCLCRRSSPKPAVAGFTLTELLFTVVLLVIVALVLLPVLLRTKESSLLAACTSNLRQIGTGCSVYASENSDYLPNVGLAQTANAYQSELACRTASIPSTQITAGPFGLGQLYFYGGINNPQIFYCPAAKGELFAFDAYSASGYPWPAMIPADAPPITDGNPFVRTGYNYYPQSRILTQSVFVASGTLTIPAYNFVTVTFNPPTPPGGIQNSGSYPTPLTMSQVNLKKAMVVDQLSTWTEINHEYRGQSYGLNALFPDGHVRFQTVRGNNKRLSYAPFDQNDLWDPAVSGGPGSTSYGQTIPAFRIIMNGFQP